MENNKQKLRYNSAFGPARRVGGGYEPWFDETFEPYWPRGNKSDDVCRIKYINHNNRKL